jgi:hypothetical protein
MQNLCDKFQELSNSFSLKHQLLAKQMHFLVGENHPDFEPMTVQVRRPIPKALSVVASSRDSTQRLEPLV